MEKYQKIRQIGEGAFGKAILVRKKQSGQQLVVKEINILKMGAKEREEARKEVSVLAQLSHPNIVTYRESFEERGSLYIVMDFCEKGDLYSKINAQRGLLIAEDQIMDWFVQICLAMKHIHDRKILHRDIKSQNIFISGDGRIQLGDFGIAKVLNSTVELARTCIGTPYYLSPEICENRPYNNKSDIWSLGCVLYEMTTLKHAFEAGNMKNLVLKIIRGSYPPIPPKYSYDLRGLIAKLFKRAPKDRPSINSVLRQNFVSKRVSKFLSEDQVQEEFSHTVMHGKKINARALPPPPPSSRPPSARKSPVPGAPKPVPKYNPAAVYGVPPVRKSKENRVSVDGPKKRPGSANSAGRPGSANSAGRPGSASQDIKRKKQEMIDKEKKRREEAKKAAERKHKELIEKQKLARINKAREDNWKNMVDSLESDKKNIEKNQAKEQVRWPPPKPVENQNYNNQNVTAPKERGKYEQYHAYLDKLQQNRDSRADPPKPAAGGYMAAPRPLPVPGQPIPKWHRPGSGRTPEATPVYVADPQADRDRKLNAKAAERAKIVDDFLQRKREAALNKQRGNVDIFGNPSPQVTPRDEPRPGSAREQPQNYGAREREEQEYLEHLRQIRQQNYNERRGMLHEQQAKREAASQLEAEARKKKVEALRQQADDRAKQLKKQLEEQRRRIYEKEKAKENRPVPAPRPAMAPAPAASITAALNAVGAEPKLVPKGASPAPGPGITGALKAIGAEPRSSQETEAKAKTVFQQQKEEILRRVNEKSQREKWEETDKGDESECPDTARSKWGEEGQGDKLKDFPLEMTASQMEATTQQDKVIKITESQNDEVAAQVQAALSRRQWGRPGSTVLNALKEAPIMEGSLTVNNDKSDSSEKSEGEVSRSQWRGKRESVLDKLQQAPIIESTVTMASDKSDESVESQHPEEVSQQPAGAIGSTITISKPPIRKGTITIQKSDEKTENSLQRPDISRQFSESNQNSESSSHDTETAQSKQDNDKPAESETDKPVSAATKPPLPSKPVLLSKPDILPKPILLPKPDAPMNFGDAVPKSVDLKEDGKVFNKVETETEDKKELEKPRSGVIMGLCTGNFDLGNAQMLRTCSEPDLGKLFKTQEKSAENQSTERKSLDLNLLKNSASLLENVELDDDVGAENFSSPKGDNQEEDEEIDDEDFEDLLSVRETMASLLLRECSTDDELNHNTGQFSLPSSKDEDIAEEDDEQDADNDDKKDDNRTDDKDIKDGDDNNDDENGEDAAAADEYQRKLEEIDVDEDDEEEEDIDEVIVDKSVECEDPAESVDDLFQSDDSDVDTQFGDDEDDYDLFSRLEESRAELETELGCDRFLKVYKTVQALQEDEDENMEDGIVIVTKMLGKEKEHLYPKIFQLVMADSAFQEDI